MKFPLVSQHRNKFLGSVLPGMRDAVLQHKRRHASLGQIFGDLGALAGDGEGHKAPARANHRRRAVS